MKRLFVLAGLMIAGVLAATVGAQQPATGQGREGGQGGAPPGGGARGPAPVVGMIQNSSQQPYWIPGAGGNTAAFVTANGVVLVDTKIANNGQAILDQVKSVTDKPITHIINTHTHGDHNGSNMFFPAIVEIVAQENTATNMEKMPAFQEAANKHGLPDRTFKDKMTLLSGQRRHRSLLLRCGAHQRRHVRGVPQRARRCTRAIVRQQGTAAHRQ